MTFEKFTYDHKVNYETNFNVWYRLNTYERSQAHKYGFPNEEPLSLDEAEAKFAELYGYYQVAWSLIF